MFSNFSYILTNLNFVYLCLPLFKWRIYAQILCLFYHTCTPNCTPFWELQLHCCMCCYFTSLDHLAGSCFPELPLCCWVWVVMVMVEVELGAWLFVGLSMLCTWIAISILKNLAFSGLNLGWLSCSSWWAPSPGCWLVWCGWGSAWGVGSVGLCWQRNRVCLNVVSHLVICHPSILVVY